MRTMTLLVLVGVGAFAVACTPSPGPPPSPVSTGPSGSAVPSGPPGSSGSAAPSTPACATSGWGTETRESAVHTTDALVGIRAGRHDCYDRVVFDIAGPAEVGYQVGYVPVVTADGSGEPVPVAGSAALQVVVRAPAQPFDADADDAPVFAKTGDYFYTEAQLAGWQSLRGVRFAGFFEGECTIAIGVSATLPFQVSTQLDPTDNSRKLIVDIAHPS